MRSFQFQPNLRTIYFNNCDYTLAYKRDRKHISFFHMYSSICRFSIGATFGGFSGLGGKPKDPNRNPFTAGALAPPTSKCLQLCVQSAVSLLNVLYFI